MVRLISAILAFVLAFAGPALAKGKTESADPTERAILALDWKRGPAPQAVTARAAIQLPPKTMYLDAAGTSKFLQLTGNLSEPESYTIAAEDLSWFAIVDFNEMGYVKDDEKIDPDALLATMKEQQQQANSQRLEQKLDALFVKGWSVVPHYDAATHNLEYGLTLGSGSGENINYTTRMLGRRGVMNATLVTSGADLQADLGEFRTAMKGFAYKPEESYAAYKDGDKVSEYGLAALVTGGAAAAALKTGLLGGLLKGLLVFWKLIAVAVVGFFALIGRFFKRVTGSGEDLGPPPGDAAE
jgi:uncharacterized membrane-anchored protein